MQYHIAHRDNFARVRPEKNHGQHVSRLKPFVSCHPVQVCEVIPIWWFSLSGVRPECQQGVDGHGQRHPAGAGCPAAAAGGAATVQRTPAAGRKQKQRSSNFHGHGRSGTDPDSGSWKRFRLPNLAPLLLRHIISRNNQSE